MSVLKPSLTLELLQDIAIDFQAMTMALAALLVLPLPQLSRHRPHNQLCKGTVLIHLAIMAPCLFLLQLMNMSLMATRPWFKGGTGTEEQVQNASLLADPQTVFP